MLCVPGTVINSRESEVTKVDNVLVVVKIIFTGETENKKTSWYGVSSSHIRVWELDHREGWVLKNWCFWIVALEKTLESPLDCKETKLVLKEINHEYSLEGLMLKLKLQYFGCLMWRGNSLEKTLMLGKTESKKEKGATEEEMGK